MKSIASNFQKIAKRNPNLGTCPCLAAAVMGKGFSRKSLARAYYSLMQPSEYLRSESKSHIDHLVSITKPAEEVENRPKKLNNTTKGGGLEQIVISTK